MSVDSPLAHRLNFSLVLPGRLAGLAWPFRRGEDPAAVAGLLRGVGVAVLANLTGEPYPTHAQAALDGIHCVDLAVEDYAPPQLQQVEEAWALFTSLAVGQVLAFHCAAGMGRTGTFLACLAGRELSLDGPSALDWLRKLRPGSVETLAQEELVLRWLDDQPRSC